MGTSRNAEKLGAQTAQIAAARAARRGPRPLNRTAGKTDAEVLGAARRMILGYGERAALSDPEQTYAGLQSLHEVIEQATLIAVVAWRKAGYSWREIGAQLTTPEHPGGVSRQAAENRWAARTEAYLAAEAAGRTGAEGVA